MLRETPASRAERLCAASAEPRRAAAYSYRMGLCFYCGRSLGGARHPREHVLPAAVGGTLLTDRICAGCNRQAGSEVDQPWQNWPLIMELRHRFAVPDRDGKPPRPVRWTGALTAGGGPAAIDVKGQRVDVRILPTEDVYLGMRVHKGEPADIAKRTRRILRDAPEAEIVNLPSATLPGPLSAQATWELDVHVWPRFAAKVALGIASLVADDEWVETQEAADLRRVLWFGDESTVEHEMLPEGVAWSLAPLDLTSVAHPLRPPEHLLTIERWQDRTWVVLVAFGTFRYGVPVSFETPTSNQPIAWLFEPLARSHVSLTEDALHAEFARRLLAQPPE